MSDRELHALITGGHVEPEPTARIVVRDFGGTPIHGYRINITDAMVEAAAHELYGSHPFAPDWDDLPDGFHNGMRRRAREILKAAMGSRKGHRPMRLTPHTERGLRKYDDLPAVEAVVKAWAGDGINPRWHAKCVAETRASLPVLARALDRLTREQSR